MENMKAGRNVVFILVVSLFLVSCGTIEKQAMKSVADMLSSPSGSQAFTSDDDPQLVADSLPLALKIYEIILEKDPENDELAASTGKNFVMYSGGFVQMPADMLEDEKWREADAARKRAKKLYRRGRDYLLMSLEIRHPGFTELLESEEYDAAVSLLEVEDADEAYWAGLGWLGMASTDPFDMELTTTLDRAELLLYRSLELNPDNAGVHDVMIQIQLSLPPSILINLKQRSPHTAAFINDFYKAAGVVDDAEKRAQFHYDRALALSKGADPSPHITMATAVSVKSQDVAGFRDYLDKALSIDPEMHVENRLMIILYQEKARWLLEHIEDYFLVDFS